MDYQRIVEATRKKLLKNILLTEEEADKLSREIVKAIQEKLRPDLSNLDRLIEEYLEEYANSLVDKLFKNIKTAAEAGFLTQALQVLQEPERENLTSKIVEELINHRYPDGLNLSERVWSWKKELKTGLKKTLINQAKIRNSAQKIAYELQYTIEQIEKGKFTITMAEEQLPKIVKKLKQTALLSAANGGDLTEWRKIVKQAEKYIEKLTDNIQYGLKPAYKKLIKDLTEAIEKRSEEAVHEAVKWWLYDKQLYRFKVIARTEMSNAYYRSVIESTKNNPFVVGYRWKLSRSHRIRDICDDLAHRDHGLGLPGVFPKDRVPLIQSLASHPQCLCYIEPVTASEVKGMDRIERVQIQVRTILKDYHNMISHAQSEEEFADFFRSLFKKSQDFWKHLFKHAIPKKVAQELRIDNWRKASRLSQKLLPFQINYAMQFVDTLSYIDKIAIQELPNSELTRLVFFSSKSKIAVVFESSGEVATLFELDKFKSWNAWKNYLSSRGIILEEVPIGKDIRKLSLEIRNSSKKFFK